MAGFSIYPRKRKNGKPVYYAQFKKSDGTYTTAKSTGCSTRRDAVKWCEDELFKKGIPLPGREISFAEYSKGFFDWDSPWTTDRRVRGLRISKRHCRERTDIMRLHILPALGDKPLSEIDRGVIKNFRNDLFDREYSGSTINHCLSAIKSILESAEEQNHIKYVPRIDRAANNPKKQRGILTPEEVQRLFSYDINWYDERGRIGNLLAAASGLRLGELQSLQLRDIHLEAGYIHIHRSYDRRERKLNQTTKTGKARNIFISSIIKNEIEKLISINPWPDNPESFLFFSFETPGKPTEQLTFLKSFYKALQAIGISEAERKQRNIVFHGWRA